MRRFVARFNALCTLIVNRPQSLTGHIATVVFHAKKDRATNANAHLAHLQALTHKPMLQLAKEPNFCQHTD